MLGFIFIRDSFGLIGCLIMIKLFVSQTIVAMETEKRYFFSYCSNGFIIVTFSRRKKCFIKNVNLIDTYYLPLLPLDAIVLASSGSNMK